MRSVSWTGAVGVAGLLGILAVPGAGRAEEMALAAGQTIRVTPPPKVDVPGVVSVSPKGEVTSSLPVVREGDGTVRLQLGEKTLCVPTRGTRVVGKLVSVDEKGITILRNQEPREVLVPREALAKVEVRPGLGATGVGMAVGAAAGFAAGWAVGNCHDIGCGPPSSAVLGVLFAFPAGAIGGLIGHAMDGGNWRPVSPERLRLVLAPRPRGAVAAVTVRF